MRAYCYRSGLIGFGRTIPLGCLPLGHGDSRKLHREVSVLARHGECGSLWVPRVSEHTPEDIALARVAYFRDTIYLRLEGKTGWPPVPDRLKQPDAM